jgi:hypothetical protein
MLLLGVTVRAVVEPYETLLTMTRRQTPTPYLEMTMIRQTRTRRPQAPLPQRQSKTMRRTEKKATTKRKGNRRRRKKRRKKNRKNTRKREWRE